MTETQTEAPAENTEPKLPSLEEAFKASADSARDLIAQANAKIAKQNAAVKWLKENSRDPQETVDALKSGETENAELKPLLEKEEKAKMALQKVQEQILIIAEKAAKEIVAKDTDEDAVKKHTEAYEVAVKNVRDIRKALETIFTDKVLAYLDDAQTLKRKSAGSPGSGPPRLRGFTVKVDGQVAKKKMGKTQELKSSFGAAADKIGDISTPTLVKKYQQALNPNGEPVTDSTKYPVGEWTEFEVTVGDKTYKVEAMREEDSK